MATTTNFGWETPDDTDLVKDGAAAIRTALGGVDTSFVDLKGGTTGQILSKASNTDLDFSWIPDGGGFTYATYTPTFTAFTKGNATITARWAQSGKAVNVFVEVILGNTSSVTGSITVSLPVTAATNALGSRGIGGCGDSGVRTYSAVSVLNSTTAVEIKPLAASLATVAEDDLSATNPMTWTTNDRFFFNLTYEAA